MNIGFSVNAVVSISQEEDLISVNTLFTVNLFSYVG